MSDTEILKKVEEWLIEEVYDGAKIVEAKDAKDEQVTSDDTENIIYGRAECAESLLKQISTWKAE